MGNYEKEISRLQTLWNELQSEDEDVETDNESDIDHVSINSDYAHVEQAAREFEDEKDNPVEEAGAAANIEDNDVTGKERNYVNENGTMWRKKCYNRNVRTRAENLILQLAGVKSRARDNKRRLECFLMFINEEMLDIR